MTAPLVFLVIACFLLALNVPESPGTALWTCAAAAVVWLAGWAAMELHRRGVAESLEALARVLIVAASMWRDFGGTWSGRSREARARVEQIAEELSR